MLKPDYAGISQKWVRDGFAALMHKYVLSIIPTPLALYPVNTTSRRPMGFHRTLHVEPPKAGLPKSYNILISDYGLIACATHVFAVYTYAPADSRDPRERIIEDFNCRRPVSLYPTHAVMWAAHCSRLPQMYPRKIHMKLQRDPRPGPKPPNSALQLPLVPIPLPYPEGFLVMQKYFYTLNSFAFLREMIMCGDAVPPGDRPGPIPRGPTLQCYAEALAEACSTELLLRFARTVHGVYRNMLALGAVNDKMWDCIDFAWDALLTAMDLIDVRNGVNEE